MKWHVDSILDSLGIPFEILGDTNPIKDAHSLDTAGQDDLAFCSSTGTTALADIMNSHAGMILCKKELRGTIHQTGKSCIIFVDNPRLAFVKILSVMNQKKHVPRISQTAVIDPNATIGENCTVGDFAVIGPGCKIGKNTVVGHNVILSQNCIVGSNCIIQPGASLGSDGFAFEREPDGSLIRFPHKGYVRIGENVEVSANCSIARGSLSDTIIGNGTKLDALVHVAHNVSIGNHCELTAGTVIGGSTIIGDMCWLGLNSTIKNKLRIGGSVIVASGASVISDVVDGDIVAGVPAKSIKHKVKSDELFLMAGQERDRAARAEAT
jgi:UDP-3-O-[3-hydroxymyristoyl] glucosamine N-acyltransferase